VSAETLASAAWSIDATAVARRLVANVERAITGKREVVELAVVTLLAGGHLLLEDVPGVGKTLLARALARSLGGEAKRIQGAPDLLPADLTGSSVYRQDRGTFVFVPGPLFANVVLVDEANRTAPRTQAALLEAMEEGQVTVDGVTHRLPDPHFVIATQNPQEQHGTFPLPESQLDRFTAATGMGYPVPVAEAAIVRASVNGDPLDEVARVLDLPQLLATRGAVRAVAVSDETIAYAVRLVRATRAHPGVALGASPRAAVHLVAAGQARAALEGRDHVLPDDLKRLAVAVLAHRLTLARETSGELPDRRAVVADLLVRVPVAGR
jgi:MoxR-like ATPase